MINTLCAPPGSNASPIFHNSEEMQTWQRCPLCQRNTRKFKPRKESFFTTSPCRLVYRGSLCFWIMFPPSDGESRRLYVLPGEVEVSLKIRHKTEHSTEKGCGGNIFSRGTMDIVVSLSYNLRQIVSVFQSKTSCYPFIITVSYTKKLWMKRTESAWFRKWHWSVVKANFHRFKSDGLSKAMRKIGKGRANFESMQVFYRKTTRCRT